MPCPENGRGMCIMHTYCMMVCACPLARRRGGGEGDGADDSNDDVPDDANKSAILWGNVSKSERFGSGMKARVPAGGCTGVSRNDRSYLKSYVA